MATNIGNLSFGIDANTKGLRNAIAQLNRFKTEVNKTAKSQADGAKKLASAMARQESAIKKAFQATLKMQQAQRRAGAPIGEVARTTNAFKKLTAEMTRGSVSTLEFTRSQDAFAAKLGRSQRALKDLSSAAGGDKLSGLTTRLRNLESASVLAVGPLSGLGARIRSLGAIAGRSSLRLVGMFAGITAAIVGFVKLSAAAINAGKVFESSMARFEAASGSLDVARKQMSFVIKVSQDLGLRIDTTAKAFSRLAAASKGTSLEGDATRRIFLAVSKAAAALRLSGGEVEGTFRAIEQMMSKGTVQAEELRGQLGERLPGAFRLAAEAMEMTTSELGKALKAGEIFAEVFLPKLADALEKTFAAKALDNVNSFTGSMNVLANESLLFAQAFNKAANISAIFIGAIQKLSGAIRFMNDNLNNLIAGLGAAAAGMIFMSRAAIVAGLLSVAAAIKSMAISMAIFNVVLAANPFVAVASFVVRFIAVLGVVVATFFGIKLALDATTDAVENMDSALDDLTKNADSVSVLGAKFQSLATNIKDARAETKVYEEVLGFMDRIAVRDIPLMILAFENLAEAQGLTNDGLKIFAEQLDVTLGSNRRANIELVSDALFGVFARAVLVKEELAKVKLSEDALRGGIEQLAELQLRLQALQEGQTAVDFFDDVESAVQEFNATFTDTNVLIKDRLALEAAFRAALMATIAAEDELDAAEKRRQQRDRDAETLRKKAEKGFIRAANVIKILRTRVAELAKGPDSFEVFTKVTEKVMKFRDALELAGGEQEIINAKVREYTELLELQLTLTDKVARAAQSMAQAITKTLEDLLVVGGSVRDMLHQLAQQLLRVALQSLFLDKLTFALSKIIGGGAFPGIIPAGGGGGTAAQGGGEFFGPPRFAHGGSFTLPGSGGSDKVPVSFFGKPGEVVTVQRPDQIAARGHGAAVTITQINHFEGGGLADPNVLIPLIQENNRLLKAELLDSLDRGGFA